MSPIVTKKKIYIYPVFYLINRVNGNDILDYSFDCDHHFNEIYYNQRKRPKFIKEIMLKKMKF